MGRGPGGGEGVGCFAHPHPPRQRVSIVDPPAGPRRPLRGRGGAAPAEEDPDTAAPRNGRLSVFTIASTAGSSVSFRSSSDADAFSIASEAEAASDVLRADEVVAHARIMQEHLLSRDPSVVDHGYGEAAALHAAAAVGVFDSLPHGDRGRLSELLVAALRAAAGSARGQGHNREANVCRAALLRSLAALQAAGSSTPYDRVLSPLSFGADTAAAHDDLPAALASCVSMLLAARTPSRAQLYDALAWSAGQTQHPAVRPLVLRVRALTALDAAVAAGVICTAASAGPALPLIPAPPADDTIATLAAALDLLLEHAPPAGPPCQALLATLESGGGHATVAALAGKVRRVHAAAAATAGVLCCAALAQDATVFVSRLAYIAALALRRPSSAPSSVPDTRMVEYGFRTAAAQRWSRAGLSCASSGYDGRRSTADSLPWGGARHASGSASSACSEGKEALQEVAAAPLPPRPLTPFADAVDALSDCLSMCIRSSTQSQIAVMARVRQRLRDTGPAASQLSEPQLRRLAHLDDELA